MAGPADAGGMLTPPRDAAAPSALGPALLDAIFAQSPFSIALYDRRGHVVAGNVAYERHWGIRLADIPGNYSILDDPQLERDGLLALVRRAYAGESVVLPVTRYDAAEATGGAGRTVWTQGHCYPVRDAAGEVTHVAVIHEDATARVQGELALRASETKLAALFEAEQRTSAEARRAAERTARLQAATAALARAASPRDIAAVVLDQGRGAVGASAGSLYAVSADGRTMTALARTGYPEAVAAATERIPVVPGRPMSDAVLNGTPVYIASADEAGRRYPDMGALFHASGHEAMGILRVDAGAARYALAFSFREARALPAEDRAMLETLGALAGQALERAAAYEAERAARGEAEAANRAKSEFLAVMSHELRTPLNAIGGYAELMSLGIRGPVTEAQREDLDRIQRSQQHLLGLINEVLNYARLDAGSVRYESQDLPATEAVASAVALVAPQARAKGIVLGAHQCDPGLLVRADPEKLRQVLINLLSNAVKFTERGGRVEVGCEARDGAGEPPRTAIWVRDTGVGVPADKLEAIFEPFVQVDKRLTRTSEGVGLGLSISRDLARGMDGELTAASTPGAGSTFTIVLPRPA